MSISVLVLSLLTPACGSSDGATTASTGGGGGASSGGGAADPSAGAGGAGRGGSSGAGDTGGGANLPTSPDGGGAPIELTAFGACVEYVEVQCNRKNSECRGGAPVEDPCPNVVELCPDFLFSDGSTRTVEEIAACTEEWRTFPCERIWRHEVPDCVLPGSRDAGEPCLFGTQCVSGACGANSLGACGTCLALASEDGSCSSETACPSHQECGSDGNCEDVPTLGLSAGDLCERAGQCPLGHSCSSDLSDGTRRCTRRPTLGEPCPDGRCSFETFCSDEGVCVPLPPAGQPCYLNGAGQLLCGDGAYCDLTATPELACAPQRSQGESCAPTDFELLGAWAVHPQCQEGLVCSCRDDSCMMGVCVSPRGEGQSCSEPNTECIRGTECVGTVCVAMSSQNLFAESCGN